MLDVDTVSRSLDATAADATRAEVVEAVVGASIVAVDDAMGRACRSVPVWDISIALTNCLNELGAAEIVRVA